MAEHYDTGTRVRIVSGEYKGKTATVLYPLQEGRAWVVTLDDESVVVPAEAIKRQT